MNGPFPRENPTSTISHGVGAQAELDCAAVRAEPPSSAGEQQIEPARALYLLLLAYLVVEYGRPQDVVPGLGLMRPAAIVTILLAGALAASPRRWVFRGQFWAISAFTGLLILYIPIARNNFFAYNTAWGMVLLVPFVFALPAALKSLASLKGVLSLSVLLMAYQAIFAVTHGGRGTGSILSDENDLALFVNTFLPFAYFLFRAERRLRWKGFYAAVGIAGISGIVASGSRGGFVGLLAMAGVAWVLSPRKILSLALLAMIAWLFVSLANDAYWQEMSTAANFESGTGRARVESWRAGWRMFVDNPLGVGGGNFPARFHEYQAESFSRGMWGRASHSLWFTLLPELGIVGTLAYAWLMFLNLRDSVNVRRLGRTLGGEDGRLLAALGSSYLASMAGFFASGTFLSVLYYPHFWYVTGFIVATISLARVAARVEPAMATTAEGCCD